MSAARLLARAFHEDPYIRWAEPDAARRPRTMGAVFEAVVAQGHRHGGVLHEEGIGVAEWTAPARIDVGVIDGFRNGVWRVALTTPPAVWWRLATHDKAALDRVRPFLGPRSVYLATLGVDPAMAGRGHGGRILRAALAAMRAQGDTCVLRTEQPKNVAFYRHAGFALVDESVIDASGLRVWVFQRSLADVTPTDG
jgi:ribosomal protein S18 acetylase RimI-like enzyme